MRCIHRDGAGRPASTLTRLHRQPESGAASARTGRGGRGSWAVFPHGSRDCLKATGAIPSHTAMRVEEQRRTTLARRTGNETGLRARESRGTARLLEKGVTAQPAPGGIDSWHDATAAGAGANRDRAAARGAAAGCESRRKRHERMGGPSVSLRVDASNRAAIRPARARLRRIEQAGEHERQRLERSLANTARTRRQTGGYGWARADARRYPEQGAAARPRGAKARLQLAAGRPRIPHRRTPQSRSTSNVNRPAAADRRDCDGEGGEARSRSSIRCCSTASVRRQRRIRIAGREDDAGAGAAAASPPSARSQRRPAAPQPRQGLGDRFGVPQQPLQPRHVEHDCAPACRSRRGENHGR